MKTWYKVLSREGESCHGGKFQWSLPTQDSDGNWIPGDWHDHEGEVVICQSGFHVTDSPMSWITRSDQLVCECEIAEDAVQSEYHEWDCKIAVSKVRLTKMFSGVLKMNDQALENATSGAMWRWYKDGKTHRDGDEPAIIEADGTQRWYKDGLLHRDGDLPAVIWSDDTQEWYQNGLLHRDGDLPAVIFLDGSSSWWKNGKRHRDNDLPASICVNGDQYWFQNGKFIRQA